MLSVRHVGSNVIFQGSLGRKTIIQPELVQMSPLGAVSNPVSWKLVALNSLVVSSPFPVETVRFTYQEIHCE